MSMIVPLLDLRGPVPPSARRRSSLPSRACATASGSSWGPRSKRLERELAALLGVEHAIAVSSGHRRAAARAHGARHPGRRRGHHDDLLVLRDGRRDRARRREAGVRGHRPGDLQHRSGPGRARRSRRARRRSCPCTCSGWARTWIRSWPSPTRAGIPGHRGRGAGDWLRVQVAAARRHRRLRLLLVLPEQEPRRLRRRRPASRRTTTALAKRARLLRTHGMEPKYYHHLVGGNFRMDALQAAVLRVKAPHLRAWTEAPARNARALSHAVPRRRPRRRRRRCRSSRPDRRHIFNQFVIRTPDRDAPEAAPRRAGHRHRDLLPGAVPPAAVLRRPRATARGDFPHAERAARREPRDSDLRRADRGPAGGGRRRRRRSSSSAACRRAPNP